MSRRAVRRIVLLVYTGLVFAFIFAPIVSTIVFSFNQSRFPSLPWSGFSLQWYEAIFNDPTISRGLWNSFLVAVATSVIATFIGFATAYVDYRYRFFGKTAYVALAAVPPTIPVVVLGLAMLTFQGRVGLSGTLGGIISAHVVLAAPFAMALTRMRMAELDKDMEAGAWNLGANQWRTMVGVVIPFCAPAIFASLLLTAAVSFDEFMIAWFISGLNETLPVRVLAMLQGQVSPRINAVGSIVFAFSITMVVLAQIIIVRSTSIRKRS